MRTADAVVLALGGAALYLLATRERVSAAPAASTSAASGSTSGASSTGGDVGKTVAGILDAGASFIDSLSKLFG